MKRFFNIYVHIFYTVLNYVVRTIKFNSFLRSLTLFTADIIVSKDHQHHTAKLHFLQLNLFFWFNRKKSIILLQKLFIKHNTPKVSDTNTFISEFTKLCWPSDSGRTIQNDLILWYWRMRIYRQILALCLTMKFNDLAWPFKKLFWNFSKTSPIIKHWKAFLLLSSVCFFSSFLFFFFQNHKLSLISNSFMLRNALPYFNSN